MKIKIPNTLCEPLTLRWNEMFNMGDRNELVHTIRRALHRMCDLGIEVGLVQSTPVSMMIGVLQSTAEAAGAEDVWIEFNKCNVGSPPGIRYNVGFVIPGGPMRFGWSRVLPVA